MEREEKVLQFGEGNFLRAFADYFIDLLNEQGLFDGSIVVIQPIERGMVDELNSQKGLYTVLLRGISGIKERLITSISRGVDPYKDFESYIKLARQSKLRYVISNTTEAGIAYLETDKPSDSPPKSFPAKVVVLLYERYKHFNGAADKGFIFIPCELIDDSGGRLREIVLRYAEEWELGQGFISWVSEANYFTNTLVDRIVTGYPEGHNLGHDDRLLVAGEVYSFFAIEASGWAAAELNEKLPFADIVTDDVSPYKLRKVRILNGAHTMSALAAYLCGKETVGEMMDDPVFVEFLKKGIYEEIVPFLDVKGSDVENTKEFAESVFDRFSNPYIKHYLLSIALNSVSKFRARVVPSILEYHRRCGRLPEALTLSFAALVEFYRRGHGVDDEEILEFFKGQPSVTEICARADYWGVDINELPDFAGKVSEILEMGIENCLK